MIKKYTLCKNCKKRIICVERLCWFCYLDLQNKRYYNQKENEVQYQKQENNKYSEKLKWEKEQKKSCYKKRKESFYKKFLKIFKIIKK